MSKRDNFRKGTVEMMVLALLSESDLYGYQMVQEITKRSEGAIQVQIGTLYPSLYRLIDEGYISSTEVSVGKRRVRVYYHIEPAGKELLKELYSEYQFFERGLSKVLASCNNISTEGHLDE